MQKQQHNSNNNQKQIQKLKHIQNNIKHIQQQINNIQRTKTKNKTNNTINIFPPNIITKQFKHKWTTTKHSKLSSKNNSNQFKRTIKIQRTKQSSCFQNKINTNKNKQTSNTSTTNKQTTQIKIKSNKYRIQKQ